MNYNSLMRQACICIPNCYLVSNIIDLDEKACNDAYLQGLYCLPYFLILLNPILI